MLWKGDPTHVSFVMSERAQLSAQRGLGVSDSTESFAINIWDEFEMLAPPPRATDVMFLAFKIKVALTLLLI